MATLIINDEVRQEQYIASAGQTVFAYTFEIFEDSDLDIYQILAGQQPDPIPANNLLTLNVDYTVTNAGCANGGDVILTVGAALNDIIIIDGTDIPIQRLSNFTTGGSFGPEAVDDEFDRQTVFNQENETTQKYRGLTYNPNLLLDGSRKDNVIPKLGLPVSGQFSVWAKDSSGNIISRTLEETPDSSSLRNDLASQTNGSDGASIVGYFDPATSSGTTVAAKLTDLQGQITDNNGIIGGNFSTNPWQRGTSFPDIWTTAGTRKAYAADRFYITKRDANVVSLYNVTKSSNAPTVAQSGFFTNASFRAEVNTGQTPGSITADDFWFIGYNKEGFDWQKLAERSFTVSFWARTNLPGVYSFSVRNSGLNRSYVTPFTLSLANVWQLITITIPPSPAAGTWNFTNGIGAIYSFGLGGGANIIASADNAWVSEDSILATSHNVDHYETAGNYLEIDLIKDEPGLLATGYTEPEAGVILNNAQRYYEKTYDIAVAPGTVTNEGGVFALKEVTSVRTNNFRTRYAVTKRARVEPVWYSPVTGAKDNIRNLTTAADVVITSTADENETMTGAPDHASITIDNELLAHWTVDAEL